MVHPLAERRYVEPSRNWYYLLQRSHASYFTPAFRAGERAAHVALTSCSLTAHLMVTC
jgi:hypothetical protein